jgi:hypothetical protein
VNPYESLLKLFLYNHQIIKKTFRWQETLCVHMAAMLSVASGKQVNADVLLSVKDLLKRNAGPFSNLRGDVSLSLIVLLSQSGSPEYVLQNTLRVQELLKAAGFWRNDYLAIGAAQIALHTPPKQYAATVSKARAFYDAMRQNHPLITSSDDYIFACLLANADLDVTAATAEIEQLMVLLKPHFLGASNVRQTLAHILVLGAFSAEAPLSAEQYTDRILALREALRLQKLKPTGETTTILGILSLLPGEPETIVNQVADCYASLQAGSPSIRWSGKQIRLLFACSMVASSLATTPIKSTTNATLTGTMISLIMSQHAMMIAATAGGGAATSS